MDSSSAKAFSRRKGKGRQEGGPRLTFLVRGAAFPCADSAWRDAEAARASAVYLAEAREVAAKAEGEAATNLEQKRRFEQQLRLGSLDAQFAARGRKVLSGDAGAQIMKSLVMVRDELAVSSAASS